MLLKSKFIWIIVFSAIFSSCLKEPDTKKIDLGSDLNRQGEISDTSLSYKFKLKRDKPTIKQFCNYIYFKGDTLCFSYKIETLPENYTVSAFFINKRNQKRDKAEHLEIKNKRIYGFSLIGSLLEKIASKKILKKKLYTLSNIELNLTVRIVIRDNNSSMQEIKTQHVKIKLLIN